MSDTLYAATRTEIMEAQEIENKNKRKSGNTTETLQDAEISDHCRVDEIK